MTRHGKRITVDVECTPMNPTGQAIAGANILMDERKPPRDLSVESAAESP